MSLWLCSIPHDSIRQKISHSLLDSDVIYLLELKLVEFSNTRWRWRTGLKSNLELQRRGVRKSSRYSKRCLKD